MIRGHLHMLAVIWLAASGLGVVVPAMAETRVIELPAGPFSGELECPSRPQTAPLRPKARDVLEPPGTEMLGGLSLPREGRAQNVNLGEYARADLSRPFSIGLWGDSHAASSYFSEELVRALGLSQDQVQPTFIPPTMARSGVRLPIRKYCESSGWNYEYAYVANASKGDFSKGLVNLRSTERNSYLWVDFRLQPDVPDLRALDVLYVPPARGDTTLLGLSVDGGPERIVELKPDGDGILRLRSWRPVSVIKLRLIVGTLVLQGMVPHYAERPALYLDTLGIPGATVRGWKELNADYVRQRDGGTAYDLVILEYGTNEGNDRNLDLEKYAADLRTSLKNLRQLYPDALCVLIGPTDRGVLVRRAAPASLSAAQHKGLLDYALIHQRIGAIQAAVGKEYSCAFWSWQDAMGGPGAAYYWMHLAPALMARDLTHLSVAGYQLSARKFVADTHLARYLQNH